jgi:hypothetical protein
MSKLVVGSFCCLLLFACQQKANPKAKIYAPEKMQQIIWDLVKANDFVGNFVRKDTTIDYKTASIKQYQTVFAIHNTNRDEFLYNYRHYTSQPALFHEVMDSLNAAAVRSRASVYIKDSATKVAVPTMESK